MMFRILVFICCLFPLFTTDAFAQTKKNRSKTVGDLLKQIDDKGGAATADKKSVIAIPTTKRIEAVQVKNISAVKPIQTKRILQVDEESGQLESVVDESITELYKLTQKYKKSPNRGELWLRLGELYVEKSKLIEFRLYEEYDKQLELFYQKKRKTKPQLNLKLAQDYNKKAIQLYEWFANDFPNDKKMDQTLFFLGYNHFQIGNLKQGAKFYEQLNAKFPRSRYVAESNFSLGEYYFDSSDWKKAVAAYDKVIQRKDERLLTFAMYKKAWCLYRLNDAPRGLNYLEKVISITKKNKNKKIRLAAEAQRDMVAFYAVSGEYKDAKEYFGRYAEANEVSGMVEKLAYMYVESGRKAAARELFNNLIDENPTSKKAVDYKFQIVNAFANAGDKKIYLKELAEFMNDYSKKSSWAAANPDAVAQSEEIREKFLRNHTLQNHKIYQKQKSVLVRDLAYDGYRLYLANFPDSKNVAEMHFFFGELLYDLKKFDKASEQYDWVATNASDSPYHEKAINNSLLAIEQDLPKDEDIRKMVGDSIKPFDLPPSVQRFENSGNLYLQKYSKSARGTEVKFRMGRLYYSYNHFTEAEKIFKEIIQESPKSKYAGFSANLILDIYNLKKDYAGLAAAGEELMANTNLSSSPALNDISNVLEKASFKKAQDLETSKDYAGSAKEYETFSKKYTKSPLKTSAEFNAGINYERSGDINAALVMYGRVSRADAKKYQREVQTASLLEANLLQKVGRYQDASRAFEAYAKANPKDPKISDIHYNLATLYEAMNSDSKAIANYEAYIRTSKKADKVNSLYKIGMIYFEKKQCTPAINMWKQFVNTPGINSDFQAEAQFDMAECYEKQGDQGKANYWYLKTYNGFRSSKTKSLRFAAESKFRLTKLDYNYYAAIRIPGDPSKQGKVLNQKLQLLNKLNTDYTDIVKLNSGPQVISSLTWLAKGNEHFASAIEQAPKPSGLKPDELKAYNDELQKIIQPRRQSAIDLYKQALKKSYDLETYTDSTTEAYAALSRYLPADYKPGKDFIVNDLKLGTLGL